MVLLSVVVFVLARLCPGDPLQAYYGDTLDRMSDAQKELARDNLGLNDSLFNQYVHWAQNVFHGDWGISFKYKQPVGAVIGRLWFNTLLLGGVSYLLTFWGALRLGQFLALREGSLTDRLVAKVGIVSGLIPTFFLSLAVILIFGVNLHLFPTGGAYSLGQADNIVDRIWHLILPVTVMTISHLWYYAYMIRNMLLEEVRKDYVLLCKAEGLPKKAILRRYCTRNIRPRLLVVMAIAVPHILGGTYIVETVFGYPGIGTLTIESALYKDYNTLMALSLLTGLVVLVCNLVAQVAGEFIDPRMRYVESELAIGNQKEEGVVQ